MLQIWDLFLGVFRMHRRRQRRWRWWSNDGDAMRDRFPTSNDKWHDNYKVLVAVDDLSHTQSDPELKENSSPQSKAIDFSNAGNFFRLSLSTQKRFSIFNFVVSFLFPSWNRPASDLKTCSTPCAVAWIEPQNTFYCKIVSVVGSDPIERCKRLNCFNDMHSTKKTQ